MRRTFLWVALSLVGCGCDGGAGGAVGPAASVSRLSLAQQTVGTELLPPEADIAGTATVSTDLPDEDLPPDAHPDTASDLLPPT